MKKKSTLTIHEMLTKITYEPIAKINAQKRFEAKNNDKKSWRYPDLPIRP